MSVPPNTSTHGGRCCAAPPPLPSPPLPPLSPSPPSRCTPARLAWIASASASGLALSAASAAATAPAASSAPESSSSTSEKAPADVSSATRRCAVDALPVAAASGETHSSAIAAAGSICVGARETMNGLVSPGGLVGSGGAVTIEGVPKDSEDSRTPPPRSHPHAHAVTAGPAASPPPGGAAELAAVAALSPASRASQRDFQASASE